MRFEVLNGVNLDILGRRDPALYGRLAITEGYARCEEDVVEMLRELHRNKLEYAARDGEEWLDATANARLVKNAEAYYRVMYEGSEESWNLRDTHMFETLCALLDAKGPDSKAIICSRKRRRRPGCTIRPARCSMRSTPAGAGRTSSTRSRIARSTTPSSGASRRARRASRSSSAPAARR